MLLLDYVAYSGTGSSWLHPMGAAGRMMLLHMTWYAAAAAAAAAASDHQL
jgi:hypothetical protein